MYIISKLNKSVNQKGSSLSLPAHPSSRTLCVHYGAGGRAGARATPFLAALFAKQKTKFGGGTPVVERFAFTTGQEARAGPEGETSFPYGVNKNSCFLPAPLQAEGFAMRPARSKVFKSQRPDFRGKKFGFCSRQTANL